jgi:TatD DNase family protein
MSGPALVDSHCHLDLGELAAEVPAVLSRAADAGVVQAVVIACARDAATAGAARELARQDARLHPTVGVHPHDAKLADAILLAEVERVAADPRIVAVGEIGLDFHYDFSPREIQGEVFRWQIDLARRLGKPVVIHTREARAETLAILREAGARDVGGVFHCFTEDEGTARAALDLGFHVSFSGIVTFKTATELREVARLVPADRLLVETDSPYLAPVPHRGKRCEPAFVRDTALVLAQVRGEAFPDLARTTADNARRLFRFSGPNP